MYSSTYETASQIPLLKHQTFLHKRDKDCSCARCREKTKQGLRVLSPLQSIIQEIEEERTVTLTKTTVSWTGPHPIGRELGRTSGGGIYVVIRNGKPIYVGQTGSFSQRFTKHFSSLHQMGCDVRQQKIYLGKISLANGSPVTESVRKNVESVIIRTYLKKAVRLQNRTSIKAFKTSSGGLFIYNKGIDLPPGLNKLIKHPQGSLYEIPLNDRFISAEFDYQNSWMAELFPDAQFEFDQELNEASIDYPEQEDELEFRGRRRKRPPRSRSRSSSKLRSKMNRRRRPRKPRGSIKPRFLKPRKRPIFIRSRRRPRRRPVIIREPAAPCVCPVHGTEFVRWVQSSLNQIMKLRLRINGVMNHATRNALRDFQKREGLPVDGIGGPETERALVDAKAGRTVEGKALSDIRELEDFELDTDSPDLIDFPKSYGELEIIKKPGELGQGDSRRSVKKSEYKVAPYRYICQIELVTSGGNGIPIGTGILVGPRSILTAAHVLFQSHSTYLESATEIRVTPARRGDENLPFGSSFAVKLIPNPRYTHLRQNGTQPKSVLDAEDYGIIHLDQLLGNTAGYWGQKTRSSYDKRGTSITGGPLPYRPGVQKVNLCGYPGDKSGKFQWRAYDETVELSDRVLYYLNDTTAGMSGSPVWVKRSKWKGGRILVGIHGGGGDPPRSEHLANRAAYCDKNMVEFIQKHFK